jgi:hypothetical protein
LSSLVFTPGVAVAWRLSTAFAILVLAIRPLRGILWCRGARAVTRAEWDRQGQWRIGFKDQQPTDAVLLNESAILGPCLFLIWSQRGRRRYALIDRPTADPYSPGSEGDFRSKDGDTSAGSNLAPDRLRASCETHHATSVLIGRTPEL